MLPIHFAPLQGYTDSTYRMIHSKLAGGVDVYYTPFIRWEGFRKRETTDGRTVKGDMRGKDVRDIEKVNNQGIHLIPQIICGNTDELNHLSDMIAEQGYSEIDINMGCPAPMQTKLKRGSGLLPHPDLIEKMVGEMEKRKDIRYSVKIRLGLEDANDWRAFIPILNDAPIQHITLHPRTGRQMYKSDVDMGAFGEFYAECRKPLIYNGDVKSVSDIEDIARDFPQLAGIMIGRGLLARPTLAREYKDGKEWEPERRREIVMAMHEHMLNFCTTKYKVDSQILLHIHSFWEFHEDALPRKVWKKIMKAGSMKNYLEAVREV